LVLARMWILKSAFVKSLPLRGTHGLASRRKPG
jgi:hypothetical protein